MRQRKLQELKKGEWEECKKKVVRNQWDNVKTGIGGEMTLTRAIRVGWGGPKALWRAISAQFLLWA